MMRLEGDVGIVTGAGAGIGRGIARLFAKEGAKVIVADIVHETGEETVKKIRSDSGEADFVRTDVSKASEVAALIHKTVEKYGKLTILCNNAGILSDEHGLFTDLKEEDWDNIINVNLKSVFLCCKYAVPEMIKSKGGSIVNIASIAGLIKSPHLAYSASKGGIIALTRSLSLQLADFNIRANVICPGGVDTPGVAEARKRAGVKDLTTVKQRLIERVGVPEDIAYSAVYLASSEASYVTGSVLTVDGGSLRG